MTRNGCRQRRCSEQSALRLTRRESPRLQQSSSAAASATYTLRRTHRTWALRDCALRSAQMESTICVHKALHMGIGGFEVDRRLSFLCNSLGLLALVRLSHCFSIPGADFIDVLFRFPVRRNIISIFPNGAFAGI